MHNSETVVTSCEYSGGSRVGARGVCPHHLFWVEKEEMSEGRKAVRASEAKPGPHLSSKSASATGIHKIISTILVYWKRFCR